MKFLIFFCVLYTASAIEVLDIKSLSMSKNETACSDPKNKVLTQQLNKIIKILFELLEIDISVDILGCYAVEGSLNVGTTVNPVTSSMNSTIPFVDTSKTTSGEDQTVPTSPFETTTTNRSTFENSDDQSDHSEESVDTDEFDKSS